MERRPVPQGRAGVSKRTSMRPPSVRPASVSMRQSALTRHAATASRADTANRAASPAESLSSVATAGTKRKERDFEPVEVDGAEATNINVVVRCRGRVKREVDENSAVVVTTEGVKGKLIEMSMGPTALSNKTYSFDRVFSQAADQAMVFDDVVKPILDEMLQGFNCTIFAYGQTGTGKTHTMSGDMSDAFGLLSDEAGIIPRVLHALFNKLEIDDTENCVRCSFIELYNEELRDLLAADDSAKLKIYDDNTRRGHVTTLVQGVEERHITTATDGLRWLQEGSVRRQVASTNCNELSSRSHTVFTITVHVRRQAENGEDFLSVGKLNLVDLAGSENIQRSGAENKRAAEAGLINKSLLTLGRVINALVDRSPHIPYRESKLTRLLQDSLGGRTKTCIIATISPAKSNLDETISTLDYAFRAKNIRNKPQLNALINKKWLLRDFTTEIERLKTELIATRQRNGVYMSNEAYEEITAQNESRRIQTEEQGAKIETLESNLRNKVQELFSLTSSFMGLKKEHEGTRVQLDETKEVLDQTELVLTATKRMLAEEAHVRKAHEATEEKLSIMGRELITTLNKTVSDVGSLRAKNKRKSDLQSLNRSTWGMSQAHVSGVTELVEGRIEQLRHSQEQHITNIADRMRSFVRDEVDKLSSTEAFLNENLAQFGESRKELVAQSERSNEEMDDALEEIKVVRDNIKQHVGESLGAIASAAERIAADVLAELGIFHEQLHTSYSSLGRDFRTMFEDLVGHIGTQKAESDRLRQQLEGASGEIVRANTTVAARMQEVLDEERRQAAAERQSLLAQITTLIHSQAERQESRLAGKTALIQQVVVDSSKTFGDSVAQYAEGMNAWSTKDNELLEDVARSRDMLRNKLQADWTAANEQSTAIQSTTQSVHAEAVRVVDEQLVDLDMQMRDLDDFVTRARTQNAACHEQGFLPRLQTLSGTVASSLSGVSARLRDALGRAEATGADVDAHARAALDTLVPISEDMCRPLARLREDVRATALREYEPTGDTPEKTLYAYPTELPRTLGRDELVTDLAHKEAATAAAIAATPSKGPAGAGQPYVFHDGDASSVVLGRAHSPTGGAAEGGRASSAHSLPHHHSAGLTSLREMNPNVSSGSLALDTLASSVMSLPPGTLVGRDGSQLPTFGGKEGSSVVFRRSTRSSASHHGSLAGGVGVGAGQPLLKSSMSGSLSSAAPGLGPLSANANGLAFKTTRIGAAASKTAAIKQAMAMAGPLAEGRENMPPSGVVAAGLVQEEKGASHRRKSPRLH